MNRTTLLLSAFLSTFSLLAQSVENLPPLSGKWVGSVNGERYVENWTCSENSCEGRASSFRGDTEHQAEIMRIMEFAGHWHLLVWMDEGPAVAFTLTAADEDTMIFENKDNDFPKLISYTVTADSLNAYITGPGKEGDMRLDFKLKRVK